MNYWLLILYCALILMASLAGGMLPLIMRLTHATMQFAVSFVAGVMLGVGFLHMIPEAAENLEIIYAMPWVLGGFLLMFFIQRYLVVHQHLAPHEQSASEHQCGESDEVHHHAHEDFPSHQQEELLAQKLSWSGAALGLFFHSLLNGVALASTFEAQRRYPFAGVATFVAIFVHKPFDSLTITTLMAAAGWSRKACHTMNVIFSLAIPIGVGMYYLGLHQASSLRSTVQGCALGVSAGVFLCIAASDLLPEMHFHAHDRGWLSVCLLAGVGLAFAIAIPGTWF